MRFCFIGGLAVLRWGEPRETVDVDLTLITGFGHESEFVSVLTAAFQPRIDDAAAFAQVNRVLLLRAASGVGLDIALGGLPFEELVVARSTLFTYPPELPLRTCRKFQILRSATRQLRALNAPGGSPRRVTSPPQTPLASGRVSRLYYQTGTKELPCHCHGSSCLPSAFAPPSS